MTRGAQCVKNPTGHAFIRFAALCALIGVAFAGVTRAQEESRPPAVPTPLPAPDAKHPFIHLIPPLEANPPVTSSFGERRLTHLHSGYDLSTSEEIGWPVRAPADGEIFRLKVERRGYGRALYLRHADGFSTNYGHLFAYDETTLKLETKVREAQKKSGRFPGDIYLDSPIPVKVGQIIAYSGEAGVGLPHLHFELRLNDGPVDPAIYSDFNPPAPGEIVIAALWVLNPAAGAAGGRKIPLVRGGDGVFTARDAASIPADARLALEAWDQAPSKRRGLGEVTAQLDGRPWYSFSPDRFDFRNYFEAGWLFNPVLSGGGRFVYNLQPPGVDAATLLFPGVKFPAVEPFAAGPHELRFSVKALSGAARARVAFTGAAPFPASVAPTGLAIAANARLDAAPWKLLLPGGGLPRGTIRWTLGESPKQSGLVATAIPSIAFAPDEFYSREAIQLAVAVPDSRQADLYFFDNGRWEAMNADKGLGVLSARIRALGKFAVFLDRSPPVVGAPAQRTEPRLNLVRHYWPVSDAGEGVEVDGCEAAVPVTRGAPIPPAIEIEYDPDRGWAEFFRPPGWTMPKGIEIVCADRAGNRSAGKPGRHSKRVRRRK